VTPGLSRKLNGGNSMMSWNDIDERSVAKHASEEDYGARAHARVLPP